MGIISTWTLERRKGERYRATEREREKKPRQQGWEPNEWNKWGWQRYYNRNGSKNEVVVIRVRIMNRVREKVSCNIKVVLIKFFNKLTWVYSLKCKSKDKQKNFFIWNLINRNQS